jgi:hypothetical protein
MLALEMLEEGIIGDRLFYLPSTSCFKVVSSINISKAGKKLPEEFNFF